MRRCCAQLINSRCRYVNSTSGLTSKYNIGNIIYNSVRQFSVTPFALKNASSSSSRKPAEKVGKNSKRSNSNSNKENNKAGMMFSHKTMEIEAIPITLQTSNDNKSSTNYAGRVDYDDKDRLASFVKETESTATLKELSNLTRKASQQRKRAVRNIPSLSASVIVEPVSSTIRNNSKVQRRKNNNKYEDDTTETVKQKKSASRSREQKRQDKLINTLLLNTMVVEENEVAASVPELELTSAHTIEMGETNNRTESNKRKRGRPCSATGSKHNSKTCKKNQKNVNNKSSEMPWSENDTPTQNTSVAAAGENDNHVLSTQRTRKAKSKTVRCASESNQAAEINHADINKAEVLPEEQKQQEEESHDTPSVPSMTCTNNHNSSYVLENNDNNGSKMNNIVFNDKENKSHEEVDVNDAKVEDNNNLESNKKITKARKSSKVRTSKVQKPSPSSLLEERRQSQRLYKEKERKEKYNTKSKCKGKNEKQTQGSANHGQKERSQITVSEPHNQPEEQERDVGNNTRELNEDELIAQRASITKLFMVSDSVGFMFSAPPWDQQTILKELNEVDRAISSRPEVHNTNDNIVNSQYKKEDNNDNDNNDDDTFDTSEYDSHLAYLASTPYFSQDKNYTSNSCSNNNKRRTKDSTNTKSKKRHALKPLSRKEAFMKVTDVFRRMLIEYGASHKIYIHVRDLQEQTPPAHLLPSSSENQNTQMEGADVSESSVEQAPMTSTKRNMEHKLNEDTKEGSITNSTNANVDVPTTVSVLTDLERFIKLQEWRKLAHAQAEKLKVECSVPAKYHTITRVRFADPTRMNWTIVLQSNAAKNVYEIIAELEEEERRKKLNVASAQGRRDRDHNLRNEPMQLSHDQNDNNPMYQKEHWDDMLISSGTEAVEENFEEELLEEEDEHMNDGTESDGYDDDDTNVNEQTKSNNIKNKDINLATLDRRRVAFWCMQEFSKLAQNVLRNSKHGQNLHNQLKTLQMLQQQQQQQQQHLLSTSANKVKLISCVNERNPFFLKPLLTVCATCVPRRESRLGQRVSEKEFFTGKVDSSSIWLNGIKFGNFPIGTSQARRAKKKNDGVGLDADGDSGDDEDNTGENREKNKSKAHHHKRKNALVPFPLREMSEHELDNVVQRRGVPAMPRYSTRITMLIEHNELSPTDLISIAEERRGVARNERQYDNYLSARSDNYNDSFSHKNSAASTSPFSLQEPVISECNTQRQVYEKVKAANKLNKPIRLFCLITDGSF